MSMIKFSNVARQICKSIFFCTGNNKTKINNMPKEYNKISFILNLFLGIPMDIVEKDTMRLPMK